MNPRHMGAGVENRAPPCDPHRDRRVPLFFAAWGIFFNRYPAAATRVDGKFDYWSILAKGAAGL